MAQGIDSPSGPVRSRSRRLGLAEGLRRPPPAADAPVSDEQIRALVTAAELLSRRQRERCDDRPTAAADERLLRLDWAVRAGRLVLADRAAPDPAPAAGTWGQTGPVSRTLRRLTMRSRTSDALEPACEAPRFGLAGWVSPGRAGSVDVEHVLDGGTLHLSITDAVGGMQAAALGADSLRDSRRRARGLPETAQQASAHLVAHAAPEQLLVALLGRLDLLTGALELVNAGHTSPLLVRDGRVHELALEAGLILGVVPDHAYAVQRFQLRPGDRLALVTQGMSGRDAAESGVDVLLGTLGHLQPREAVQALTAGVLELTGGAVRDDAAVLLVDWYGSSPSPAPVR